MLTYLVAFLVFLFMFFLLSLGYILSKKNIKGSCGGINGRCCEQKNSNCVKKI